MRRRFEPATFSSRTRSAITALLLLGICLGIGVLDRPVRGGVDEAHAPDAGHKLADLAWIAGAWVGERDEHRFEEHWTVPAAGCMTGMFRWTVGDRLRVHELIVLEEEAGGVIMRLRHFGGQMQAWEEAPLVFRLVRIEDGTAIFEQREVESPKRLEYRFDDDADSLVVALIETHDGHEREVRFPMARVRERTPSTP